jgi:hypothetical protein
VFILSDDIGFSLEGKQMGKELNAHFRIKYLFKMSINFVGKPLGQGGFYEILLTS